MSKINVLNTKSEEVKKIDLPKQFDERFRPDLIQRAVLAEQSNKRTAYGANTRAGLRHSTKVSKRRRKYRGCYGKGISRMPRKILLRRGSQMYWVGARSPGTVGGRRAHPPKSNKVWEQKINKQEKYKALRSAMSATLIPQLSEERGHIVPKNYPFAVSADFEDIKTTKNVLDAFNKMGLAEEIERCKKKTIRAGKGTMRGRRYRTKKGILLVVSDECKLSKSASNISGVDVVSLKDISVEKLAPGCHAGRLTLWTEKAIEKINNNKLFIKA